MTTSLHKDLLAPEIHQPFSYEYADATARTSATGFVAADIGKWARQLDDNSAWMLVATTPVWKGFVTSLASAEKGGLLIPGAFSGNPKQAAVTFTTAYPDTNYIVVVSAETINDKSFALRVENKTASGFTVDLGVNNLANLVEVSWHTSPVGE
jgi:hypothetical protein